MSGPARSVFFFGLYLIGVGLVGMTAPNVFLPLVGFAKEHAPWVLVLNGVLAMLGIYYVVAARHELTPFIRATVPGRVAMLVWFTTIVLVHGANPRLILFAVPDQFGALWTFWELRKAGRFTSS